MVTAFSSRADGALSPRLLEIVRAYLEIAARWQAADDTKRAYREALRAIPVAQRASIYGRSDRYRNPLCAAVDASVEPALHLGSER